MCNRYEQGASVAEMRRHMALLDRELATRSATDNLPPQKNVYPDQDAPIIRNQKNGACELVMARWGFPPIPGKKSPITNIRNLESRWWSNVNRTWLLEPEYRCLVPFTLFAEPVRDSTWFSVPKVDVAFFAGIWRPWHGERLAEQAGKSRRARQEGDWELFAFLTTEANEVVRPLHEKAMPAILYEPKDCSEWLAGGVESLRLQRPLQNDELEIQSV